MNKKNVLYVKDLNKTYSKNSSKSVQAIKNLNLEVNEGEIFGLLGPNGAGKSTFINILAGTTIKTSGEVNVWGFNLDINPRQVRASIGIVPKGNSVFLCSSEETYPRPFSIVISKFKFTDLSKVQI